MTLFGQKKKELLEEINNLKDSITRLHDSISRANRQINISNANADLFEKENNELRDANATLLKNLNSFSKVSKQNTETVNKALSSLKEKQEQINNITNSFSKNDSIAIIILSQAKQTLGQETQVGMDDGDLIFSFSVDFLFGDDNNLQLNEDAKKMIAKIGQIIVNHPERKVFIEGLNITGEFEFTYQQASIVANSLSTTEGIQNEVLNVLVKDGNFKEGIRIRLTPDTNAFYKKLKSEFK